VLEVGPGAAARGFGHASGETVRHEAGELVDGEESRVGDLIAIEVEAIDVGLVPPHERGPRAVRLRTSD
jgi:hypothetical protein